jgi:hypothetical protein
VISSLDGHVAIILLNIYKQNQLNNKLNLSIK